MPKLEHISKHKLKAVVVAQLVERSLPKTMILGSNPAIGNIIHYQLYLKHASSISHPYLIQFPFSFSTYHTHWFTQTDTYTLSIPQSTRPNFCGQKRTIFCFKQRTRELRKRKFLMKFFWNLRKQEKFFRRKLKIFWVDFFERDCRRKLLQLDTI